MKNKIVRWTLLVLLLLASGFVLNGCGGSEQESGQVANSEGYAKLQALHAREDSLLNQYKLIDGQKGIYRIPVYRALELIAGENGQK